MNKKQTNILLTVLTLFTLLFFSKIISDLNQDTIGAYIFKKIFSIIWMTVICYGIFSFYNQIVNKEDNEE